MDYDERWREHNTRYSLSGVLTIHHTCYRNGFELEVWGLGGNWKWLIRALHPDADGNLLVIKMEDPIKDLGKAKRACSKAAREAMIST